MELSQKIAHSLMDIGAVKVSMDPLFTWTSGIRSPIYCDNRKLISYPSERTEVVRGFIELIKKLPKDRYPEYIAGTATAAIAWAAFVAQELNLPMVYIRPEKKGHGAGKQVEGDLPPGKRVVIVEDLISTGGSSLKAAQAVADECKGIVTDVLAIVTYELSEAQTAFQSSGLHLTTLTTFTQIMAAARENSIITEAQMIDILDFKKDPRSWGAHR
ncbi:orotate phosphoribosyltransferase [Candidatus Gracilibacteria bacterium]|nr:orotate phosphoribosyltransferase [Candidatus Gracilibacteria bacterium]